MESLRSVFFFVARQGSSTLSPNWERQSSSSSSHVISCVEVAACVFRRLGWAFGCFSWRWCGTPCQWWLIFFEGFHKYLVGKIIVVFFFIYGDPLVEWWWFLEKLLDVVILLTGWLFVYRYSEMKTSGIVNLVMRTKKVESPCLITMKQMVRRQLKQKS